MGLWAEEHGDPLEGVQKVVEGFVRARSTVEPHLWEDALPTLEALKRQGLKLGVITNGNCDVTQPGITPRLAEIFDFQTSASDAGAMKPANAPFLMACHLAQCHPAEIVHVGDCIRSDVGGAQGCGIRSIHLLRPESETQSGTFKSQAPLNTGDQGGEEHPVPSLVVSSLQQIPDAIKKWGISSAL
mmetsp:Transcript_19160/g.22881  ORF Transcript_19160/g.22881 Transcript_19160/m.22881 type:complete len:186 (+) Transcript_19160:1-558(+)